VLQRTRRGARLLLGLVALLVIAASVGLLVFFVAFPDEAERYTAGTPPGHFYRELDPSLLQSYPKVFGVAHNAGDSIRATKRALARGADVIEIDVVLVDGRLYGGHERPLPVVGKRVFRGPSLGSVWEHAQKAESIELDLKQSSAGFVRRLVAFLKDHRHPNTIVSSRSMSALRKFREDAPWLIRLLSVPNQQTLEKLQSSPGMVADIDGVSIRQSILDEEAATWLKEQRLLILAWVVNDAHRLNELVRLGIDAAVSDNLAMIELLGGHGRAEAALTTRRENR
jgi:hypothetical protein